MFNVYNSLAAVAVARELNLDFANYQGSLQAFPECSAVWEIKGG